jgi:type III secretory pathway component EscR
MNQINKVMGLYAVALILTVGLVAYIGTVNASSKMYEDQIEVCNFEHVCQVINIDDYMNKASADKLQSNFDKDLDTYSKLQALDEECRDNYHAFCLGQSWTDLSEVMSK